jgi:nucleotide-binding universal stress UspA family protein
VKHEIGARQAHPRLAGIRGTSTLVRRRGWGNTVGVFTHLLVGYDGSDGSRRALAAALRLATENSARVVALTVQHHLPRFAATIGEVDEERQVEAADARRLANEIAAEADEHAVAVRCLVAHGHPGPEIVRTATDIGADLIVLGHSGHTALHDRLLGSVAEDVSRHAPCSVLIVR